MHPDSRPTTLFAALFALISTPVAAEFVEVAGSAGVWGEGPTWGGSVVDIDGDGDLDILNHHHWLSANIFWNDGTGSFSIAGPQLVTDVQDRHGFLWADLDGDGVLDALCSHGGGGGCGCSDDGNELWRGLGSGDFDLVTDAGGMLDPTARGRNFSAADVDGDGDLDLHHAVAPLAGFPNRLYRNDGSMTFVDVASDWGIDEELGTVGGVFADYDDDGDPDLLVGGEEFFRPTILWRNDGGVFADVTAAALGSLPIIAGADWGDLENDGDLDLVICEGGDGVTDAWGLDGGDFWFFAHHRFGDDGIDTFTMESLGGDPVSILQWRGGYHPEMVFLGPDAVNQTQPVMTLTDAYVGAPIFDPGVDVGLYVWREFAGGPWQFHVSAPPGTFGAFSGYLYPPGGVGNPGATNLEQPSSPVAPPRVFRNDGGVFTELTGSLGLTASDNPRHVTWVDFDNDSDLDIHLVAKGTSLTGNAPDVLWRNDGAAFVPLTGPTWVSGTTSHLSDGGAWGDIDQDGDLDLFHQDGAGALFFANLAPPRLYRNEGPAGHWLSVQLGPTASGGTSVGAKVTCHAGPVVVHRRARADTWRGFQGTHDLHFGLGGETVIDSLLVDWPDGGTTKLGPLVADQFLWLQGNDPVSAPTAEVPAPAWTVGRPHPQPARGMQELSFTFPVPTRLSVRVYDVAGRMVRRLADDLVPEGAHRLAWDGRDDRGQPLPAGVYFIRGLGDTPFVRKAVRLR
jgi:hypothetical protein